MLRFIIGTNEKARRARLYFEISKDTAPSFLIVPEQFSFESEKLLDGLLGPEGARRVEVLSFSRLCNSIFRAYGGLAGEYSDDTTKLLLMGAALSQCGGSLKYYKNSAKGASFIKKLAKTDSELKNAAITPKDLLALASSDAEESLRDKAGDLGTVFSLYDAMLEKSWLDPLTDISRALALLEERDFFSGKNIYIDNFTGFTGSEYKMLRVMLEKSPSVTVSLCCPDIYDRTGGAGLFSKTQRTASRLERLAKSAGAEVKSPILTFSEEERPGALADLEENFLRPFGPPVRGNRGEVRLVLARDPYDEASFVACEIRRLCEGGMRWRDMAVIARDLTMYKNALLAAFERAGVPFYMDRPAELSSHPLAAFVSSSLSALRSGLDPGDVMRILKTGVLPVSEEDTAEFENYCFIWSIRGRLFLSDFTGNPKGLEEDGEPDEALLSRINSVRRSLLGPLGRLRERLRENCDGAEFSAALYDYLTECKVTEGLRRLYDSFSEKGDTARAEELDSFWSCLVSLLDKFSAALKGARLGEDTMSRLFELALMDSKLGSLPRTLDCVPVGTADRVRPGEPKAVFVIGVCDGVFPARPAFGGLFTESERREMSALGLDLGEGENDALLSERMYAYSAFTSPSKLLTVSRPKYDCAFNELSPSVLISSLCSSVAPLEEMNTAALPESFWLCGEELAFERLSAFGGASTPASEALKEYFLSKPLWRERAEKLGNPVRPEEFELKSREVAEGLFGPRLRLSPTRIETYESCPFSYFLKSGLSLKERRRAQLSPLSAGSLIHSVLRQVISAHGGATLSSLSDGELRAEVDLALNDYIDSVFGSETERTGRFAYLCSRMAGFLFRLLRRLGEEFKNSEFEPYAFELPVGKDSEIAPYRLVTPSGKEITIEGKIDRVDVLNKDGKRYVRVVDYKSGAKKFELCDVFYGINIQMLVYLFSIWSGGKGGLSDALPAGVLYMPARDSVITMPRGEIAEGGRAALSEAFKMNGLLLDDEAVLNAMEPGLKGVFIPVKAGKNGCSGSVASLAQLGEIKEHIDSLLIKMAEELSAGKISALPYKKGQSLSCERCSFRCVCRRGEDGPFNEHRSFKDEEFYKLAKGGALNGE